MPDRETTIKELEKMLNGKWIWEHADFFALVCKGALELLKEQEPVEAETVKDSEHGSWWFACGACGHAIDPEDNFCRECGKAVKWDD